MNKIFDTRQPFRIALLRKCVKGYVYFTFPCISGIGCKELLDCDSEFGFQCRYKTEKGQGCLSWKEIYTKRYLSLLFEKEIKSQNT